MRILYEKCDSDKDRKIKMLNSFIQKIRKYPFVILISAISIIVLTLYLYIEIRLLPKQINLDGTIQNNNIVFGITNVYTDRRFVYIEGYAYDSNSLIEYDNYISGKGMSYLINNSLFLVSKDSFIEILTTPKSLPNIIDENMLNVGYSGFISKIDKKYIENEFKIGVFINLNNSRTYRILNESFIYE